MSAIWPFAVQGALLVVDEFWCHHRRALGRWERIGHPVDTLCFVAALAFLLWRAPTDGAVEVYVALGILSCLVVTKDEWEHGVRCSGFENWLHACLFMLHPTLLIWAGYLWRSGDPRFVPTVGAAAALAAGFALYQIFFWNFTGRRHDR